MLIIGSDVLYTVGDRVINHILTDGTGEMHFNMPMIIVREATFEEYEKFVLNHPTVDLNDPDLHKSIEDARLTSYFYVVSVD